MEAIDVTYGSDTAGLVWGYLLGPDKAAAQAMNSTQALAWLNGAPRKAGEFIWLHFNLSHAASEKWLRAYAGLSDEFFETLHQGSRSTRIELVDNALVAVVNDVLHEFNFDASDISTLWLGVAPHLVISARRTPLKSIERLHQAVRRGEPLRSSVELLVHLLRDQADVLMHIVRTAVARVDAIEDSLLAGRVRAKRADLGNMRRVLVRLQRLLAPEPSALLRLLQRPPAWMSELDTQELRQSSEEFAVVLSDVSSLQERIKLLQEEIAAQLNEETGRSLYVLTIVTVLALPINIIAGMLGMNVGGIPLAQHPDGFWIIAAVVVTFTLVAGVVVARMQSKD
ncbi:transporter [Duganella qianjiadongensis]|uniref:Magnesium transporter CorA n=1 Tax=Duganella qianjiadongensis TaxID=2692176 RepID=A0ABW9VM93_9BURK|nr:transporter [Duganella qianjiadongensis]MYM38777.1 magnesium transporter CorA [Duganella qianjiadongensis]